jgi:hypothetical protein
METNPKIVGHIYRTKDYSIFKTHELNRDIKEKTLRKLRKSMGRIGWLKGSEVLVYPNMKIIDGHHRLIVAREFSLSVDYRVVYSNDNTLIMKHNQDKEVWSFIDNIQTQVKLGNQNYVLLDRYMKNFPDLRPTECIMLVKNGMNSSNREEIESGNLKLGDLKTAYEWGHQLMNIKPYFSQYYNKSIFVRAVVKVLSSKPEFQMIEFMRKLKLRPTMLKPCGTVDQYVQMIEDIYNYRRNNDEKVRLR